VTFNVIRLLQAFTNAIFRTNYPAVDKISSDLERRAVPLQQMSLLGVRL